MKVGVIGLGSMGYGIATSLLRAGHEVHGADIDPASVERLRAKGGAAGDLASTAAELNAVVVVVLNAAQVETVLFGADGIVPRLVPRSVVVLCVTVAPEFARGAAKRCATRGVLFLDAPISGGSVRAANGTLSVMASGTPDAFAAARPVLGAMAEKVFELGAEAGAGSAMKAVNQLLAGVHIAAMAEAITFAISQGIEPATFMDVIPACAGTSWMLENRGPHVAAGDYTPHSAVDIWPKDLGIVLDVGACSQICGALSGGGDAAVPLPRPGWDLAREDDAAVAKVYARNCGLAAARSEPGGPARREGRLIR